MVRDAIILGVGAAGPICAMTAGCRGFSCAVIDHSPVAGRKVRLAGGGKGNVTDRYISPEWYVGTQKGFPDTLLKRCSTDSVLSMLVSFGVEWEEQEHGQIFYTVQAARFVESVAAACRNAGVELLLNRTFGEIRHEGGLFSVETSRGTLQAPRLVITTGSPAWPACGATDGGIRLARQWGHKVIPVCPVLAPLLLPKSWPLHGLAGVNLPAAASVGGRTFHYPLLLTHKGPSGPTILQVSCFWRQGEALHIDFLSDHPASELMHQPGHGKSMVLGLFKKVLPTRLAGRLIPGSLASGKVAQLAKKDREYLALAIHDHMVTPSCSGGMGHTEATIGGVDMSNVNPRTLESRKQSGLYFAGGVLDVTGLLGGYNLHWVRVPGKTVGESWRK